MLEARCRELSPGSLIYWRGLAGQCISTKASEAVSLNAHQQHCSQTPNYQCYTRTRLPLSTFKCLMRATRIALNAIKEARIKQLEQLTPQFSQAEARTRSAAKPGRVLQPPRGWRLKPYFKTASSSRRTQQRDSEINSARFSFVYQDQQVPSLFMASLII